MDKKVLEWKQWPIEKQTKKQKKNFQVIRDWRLNI